MHDRRRVHDRRETRPHAGEAACLLATLCYGIVFVRLRRHVAGRGLPAVPVATVQVGLAAAALLALPPVIAAQPIHLTVCVAGAVLALGVLGTGLAYVWNTNVVTGWGRRTRPPSRTSRRWSACSPGR
jgi:drug/metabolite transporter (DMT)-like permease